MISKGEMIAVLLLGRQILLGGEQQRHKDGQTERHNQIEESASCSMLCKAFKAFVCIACPLLHKKGIGDA